MAHLPGRPDDISPEWLSEVLQAPVSAVRVADAHAGTTGRAVIELAYREPVAMPARLFVKLPPSESGQQAFVISNGMGQREVRFYQQLGAELPLRVPHCYFAGCDERGESYIMLLEHLEDSGCTFRNARKHYSLDYLRAVLAQFARLHAAYWESSRFATDLAWVQPPLQQPVALTLVQRALDQHASATPAVFTELGELYLAHSDAVHRLWCQGAATLVHGDVHDGNLFMDGDQPGFLDWAVLARAPAMRDVGYFLA
ncbi:MAG: aminoglycoside phosphotransferase family protein, partial [Halioglobus sp.]|nr:aminoglycoside phosphotransferase family protein [Halioglobus sp.]